MALRYAVATGNWSSTATWDGGTLPTSADDVYSNNFTVTIDQNINVLSLRNRAGSPAVAGGGFVIASSVTVTVTGSTTGIIGGGGTCVTFSGGSGIAAVINTARIEGPDTNTSNTISHAGTGTLTITCTTYVPAGTGSERLTIFFNSTGVLNYSGGTLTGNFSTRSFVVNAIGTINIIANLNAGSNVTTIDVAAAATINITGNLYGGSNSGRALLISASAIINITGTVKSSTGGPAILVNSTSPTITITGAVSAEVASTQIAINCQSTASYLKIIGAITATTIYAVNSQSTNAINIFTGPFVSSVTGIMPILVVRMHYQITALSYFEFRDSSTDGALPPAAPAPATRLVSPDTVVDAPIPANVRNGVTYALGSQTGTLKVPLPSQVSKGIQTDNTVGTAALTPEDVWNALTSSMTTPGSIGNRLKNTSTVETTGDQIASLL